jgi:hypothetical protein
MESRKLLSSADFVGPLDGPEKAVELLKRLHYVWIDSETSSSECPCFGGVLRAAGGRGWDD